MREIKFRAWDKTCGRMYTVSNITFNTDPLFVDMYGDVDFAWQGHRQDGDIDELRQATAIDTVLRRFTGLHDKNGVEIYEGAIVRVHDESKPEDFSGRAYVIAWDNGRSQYMATAKDGAAITHIGRARKRIEVIGNIYENPELVSSGEV